VRPQAQFAHLCAIAPRTPRASETLQGLLSLSAAGGVEETLQRNQLHPQAWALLSLAPALATTEFTRELEARAQLLEAQSKMQAAELAALLALLEGEGITALSFKGPAFAEYAGLGLTRESDDLDVIVARGDLARALTRLRAAGYRTTLELAASSLPLLTDISHELQLLDRHDALLLELHWRLAPPWHPPTVVEADLFGSLRRLPFLGRLIHWPAPERLLLMHVADGMKSGGLGARWLGDLAAILRRETALDWNEIRELARRGEGMNSLRIALAALHQVCCATATMREAVEVDRWFPEGARLLADEALRSPRLVSATSRIVGTADGGVRRAGALHHFSWSLRVSDRRRTTVQRIGAYLAGPAVADLPAAGGRGLTPVLRLRSLARRMRGLTRAAASSA
jgi:hypothetical protein